MPSRQCELEHLLDVAECIHAYERLAQIGLTQSELSALDDGEFCVSPRRGSTARENNRTGVVATAGAEVGVGTGQETTF
jgi:hypothetical protein